MARINIEDSLFKDDRWVQLLLSVGCKHKALGLVCGAWILAQKNWLKHGCVPAKSWPKDFDVLIEVELASVREDGSVYVKGSRRAFEWLNQKSEAGQKPSEKKLAALEKARIARWNRTQLDVNGSERTLNGSERTLNGSEAPTPTPTPTPTHSQTTNSNSNSKTSNNTLPKRKAKKDVVETELNRQIWQSYFDAYTLRYGVAPVRNGRINGQVDQLRKRLGSEAVDVVRFYLGHNDGFYLKNSHALGLCLKDAESLHTQWKRGTKVTAVKVREFEKQAQFMDTIADIRENGI